MGLIAFIVFLILYYYAGQIDDMKEKMNNQEDELRRLKRE